MLLSTLRLKPGTWGKESQAKNGQQMALTVTAVGVPVRGRREQSASPSSKGPSEHSCWALTWGGQLVSGMSKKNKLVILSGTAAWWQAGSALN